MQREYWRSVLRRAATETNARLGLTSRPEIVIKVIIALAVIGALLVVGSRDAALDEIIARAAALIVVALFIWPLVFAWRMAGTPARMDVEKSGLNTKLAARLVNKRIAVNGIRTLTVLSERGYELATKNISSDELVVWKREAAQWTILTTKYLASTFTQQEALSFQRTSYNPNPQLDVDLGQEYKRINAELRGRLEALRVIIDRHREGWETITVEQRSAVNAGLELFEKVLLRTEGGVEL